MARNDRGARRPRLLMILLGLAIAGGLPQTAVATDGALVGAPSSSWQTNGVVWALAHANGVIYLGGDFTSVRPPGAAAGTGEVPRNHLAAFDAATGELLPFDPNVDAPVRALVASSDGTKLYAGGDFRTVGGVARTRLAAFDTASGTLIAGWKPTAWASVKALEFSGGTVYVGGAFGTMSGQARSRLGAVDANTGALRDWAPAADDTVYAIAAADDGSKLFVGGRFTTMNGQAQHAIAALDLVSGASLPFPAASAIPPVTGACESVVKDLTTDATTVYVADEGSGGGCFDGTFAASVAGGSLMWKNSCLGATQAVEKVGSWLYKGSHAHDCSSVLGGFPQVLSGQAYHLLAQNPPDGLLGPWYPNTNGQPLGPEVFATDGQQLFVGGDFTTVNSKGQQGFTRFQASPDITPPVKPPTPKVASVEPGTVKIVATGTYDRDDDQLSYALLRDGSSTPIATWTASSKPWSIPTFVRFDSGLAPGSSHTYRLQVSDDGNVLKSSTSAAVTVASTSDSYAGRVKADFPSFFWRLGETSGSTAADATGNGLSGTYVGGITRGVPGVVSDSTAALYNGSTGLVASTARVWGPQTFTAEAWFRTTTTTGGKIIGFGNSQSGTSSSYDRHVYMTNSGQVAFGVFAGSFPGAARTIMSPSSYNNGNWHHFAATLAGSGMTLYVDGVQVGTDPTAMAQSYNGYWRVGGDNLNGWPSRPTSNFFNGTIDEVAVHGYALTAAQVADRLRLSG